MRRRAVSGSTRRGQTTDKILANPSQIGTIVRGWAEALTKLVESMCMAIAASTSAPASAMEDQDTQILRDQNAPELFDPGELRACPMRIPAQCVGADGAADVGQRAIPRLTATLFTTDRWWLGGSGAQPVAS